MKATGMVLAAMLVAATGLTHAHGDGAMSAGHGAAAMKNEQKPWGIAGDPRAVARTIEIAMLDEMRFSPSTIEIREGETVRLVMRNTGKLMHELVIGTKQDLDEHAALMMKFPGMEHEEPYMAHVGSGKTGEIVWTFNRAGRFDFACLIAGHYQSGMRGTIRVAARSPRGAAVHADFVAVTQAEPAMTDGEVRKVDKPAGKITLKHGAIGYLDMPPMTMVFKAREPALLERVKPGDKVRFRAEQSNGTLVVTSIEVVK